jgi:hypothetical protein
VQLQLEGFGIILRNACMALYFNHISVHTWAKHRPLKKTNNLLDFPQG